MKLAEAREIIHQVHGKPFSWLRAWGLGWIREAIRTIESRQRATDGDRELASDVKRRLMREW